MLSRKWYSFKRFCSIWIRRYSYSTWTNFQ